MADKKKEATAIISRLLTNTACPQSNQMLFYLEGILPIEACQEMEHHLLSCPVCALVKDIHEEFGTDAFERGEMVVRKQLDL